MTTKRASVLLGALCGCGLIAPQDHDATTRTGSPSQAQAQEPTARDAGEAAPRSGRWILTMSGGPDELGTLRAERPTADGLQTVTLSEQATRFDNAWSPDGRGVVYQTREGPLYVTWLRTVGAAGWSEPEALASALAEPQGEMFYVEAKWSPRGDRVALRKRDDRFGLRQESLVTLLASGEIQRAPLDFWLEWSHDGARLAAFENRSLGFYELTPERATPMFVPFALQEPNPGPWVADPLVLDSPLSADGRWAVMRAYDCDTCTSERLHVGPIDGSSAAPHLVPGDPTVDPEYYDVQIRSAVWSPQGAVLLFETSYHERAPTVHVLEGQLFLHDPRTQRTRAFVEPGNDKPTLGRATWLPGSRPRLIGHGEAVVDLTDFDNPVRMSMPDGYQLHAASPDGRWVLASAPAAESCRWALVDLDLQPLTAHDFVTTACDVSIAWSSDARMAIVTSHAETTSTGVLSVSTAPSFAWSTQGARSVYSQRIDGYEPGGRRWLEHTDAGTLLHGADGQRWLLHGGPSETAAWQPGLP